MANLDNADKRMAGALYARCKGPSTRLPNNNTAPGGMYNSFYRAADIGEYLPGGGIAPPVASGQAKYTKLTLSGGLEIGI